MGADQVDAANADPAGAAERQQGAGEGLAQQGVHAADAVNRAGGGGEEFKHFAPQPGRVGEAARGQRGHGGANLTCGPASLPALPASRPVDPHDGHIYAIGAGAGHQPGHHETSLSGQFAQRIRHVCQGIVRMI